MNIWFILAAGLSGITLFAHMVPGRKEIMDVMVKVAPSDDLKSITEVIWHAISVIIFACTLGLLFVGINGAKNTVLIALIVGQYMGFGILFLVFGVMRLKSVMVMPQWIAFLLVSVLAIVGFLQ